MILLGFLLILFSYALGAVPFGLLLSRGRGVDIRRRGSGNIGATNVSRLLGKRLGGLTLALDVAKGYFPMLLASQLLVNSPTRTPVVFLCGLGAVVGHMFPVYLRFRGGKGVATALGVFLFLAPLAVGCCLLVFVAVVGLTGYVSLGSLSASAGIVLFLVLFGEPGWKVGLATLVALLIWIKHHENIGRLLRGKEQSWKTSKRR